MGERRPVRGSPPPYKHDAQGGPPMPTGHLNQSSTQQPLPGSRSYTAHPSISKQRYLLLLVFGNLACASNIMLPLWGPYMSVIGGTLRTSGYAISIYTYTIAVFTVIAGKALEKIPRNHWSITVSYFLYGFFSIGYFFVRSPTDLFMLQFALGIAYSICNPLSSQLYSSVLTKGDEPFQWSIETTIWYFSMGLGAMLGSHLTEWFTIKYAFAFIVATSFIAGMLSIPVCRIFDIRFDATSSS